MVQSIFCKHFKIEKDLDEFILERMQKENIAEADRDVIKKATEVISLPRRVKDAKEQNIAPVFCFGLQEKWKEKGIELFEIHFATFQTEYK